MKKRLLLIAAGLLFCARAQQYDPVSSSISGTITMAGAGCDGFTCVWIHMPQNSATATVQITGSFVATLQFEASVTSTSWSPIQSSAGVSSATAPGIHSFTLNGLIYLRVRASALTVSPVSVAITSAMSGGGGGGGGGGSGTVTSVGIAMPTGFTVSGSPVTGAGTMTVGTSPTDAVTFPGGVNTGDTTKTGIQCFSGITSGQVCLSVADVAGTAITYLWPSTNGTAGQVLADSGAVTCPTLPTLTPPLPTTCHQMTWTAASGGGAVKVCSAGLGATGTATAIAALENTKTYIVDGQCRNKLGGTVTITSIECWSDAGSTTANVANNSGSGLLTGAITATSSWAAGTQSATTTLAANAWLKFTFTGDGTTKQITCNVWGTM